MVNRRFGLIGKSLKHSFSKDYFSKKFRNLDIDASYENFELNDVSQISALLEQNISGLNVTIPYKESVLPYLDGLAESAERIGAVNTIKFINGRAIGHNTDVYGFRQMIKPYLEGKHHKAMILGTGGASKAVKFVLEDIGLETLTISRNPVQGQYPYEDINEQMMLACGVIVNCTPVGMYPDVLKSPAVPFGFINGNHLVIDLIYNPVQTVLLRSAAERGAKILNGLTMLEQQAEKSWEIWNEKTDA